MGVNCAYIRKIGPRDDWSADLPGIRIDGRGSCQVQASTLPQETLILSPEQPQSTGNSSAQGP